MAMKKILTVLFAVVLSVAMLLTLVACKSDCEKGIHTPDAGTVTTQPTCTTAGEKTYKCTECGEVLADKTETVAATGHTLVDVVAVAANCTETGIVAHKKCSVCDALFQADGTTPTTSADIVAAVVADAHVWGTTLVPVEGENKHTVTCTLNSAHTKTEDCDLTTNYYVTATGHGYQCACGKKTAEVAHDFTAKAYACACGYVKTANFTVTTNKEILEIAEAGGAPAALKYYAIGTVVAITDDSYGRGEIVIKDGFGTEIKVFGLYNHDGSAKVIKPQADGIVAIGDVVVVHGTTGTYKEVGQIVDGWIVECNGNALTTADLVVLNNISVPAIAKENLTLSADVTWSVKDGPVAGITVNGNVIEIVRSTDGDINFTLVATKGTETKEFAVNVPELSNKETTILTVDSLNLPSGYTNDPTTATVDGTTWEYVRTANYGSGIQMNDSSNKQPFPYIKNTTALGGNITAVVLDWASSMSSSSVVINIVFSTTADFAEATSSAAIEITKDVTNVTVPAGNWTYILFDHTSAAAVYFDSISITTEGECDHGFVEGASNYVTKTDADATTCAIEYWTCAICDKNFGDAACTTAISSIYNHTLAYVAEVPGSCTTDKILAHFTCSGTCKGEADVAYYKAVGTNEADSVVGDKIASLAEITTAGAHSLSYTAITEGDNAGKHLTVCANGCADYNGTDGKVEEHENNNVFVSNETHHWNNCAKCQAELAKEEHDLTVGMCVDCGNFAPTAGVAYQIKMVQTNASKTVYVTGVMDGYYFGTTEDATKAADVYVAIVDGGFNLYVYDKDGAKKYIDFILAGTYINCALQAEDATHAVWSWDATLRGFKCTINGTVCYLGTAGNNTHTTLSVVKSYIDTAFKAYPIATCQHAASGLTHTEGKAADCTNTGITENWTCTCGKIFADEACTKVIATAVIDALGHTRDEAVDCTQIADNGDNHTATCSVCKLTFEHPHQWADNACSLCGYTRTETPVEEKTYSHTFGGKIFGANGTQTLSNVAWTLSGDGNYWGYDGTKGQQFGSGGNPYKTLTLASASFSNVSVVKVSISGANSINGTFVVKVGGQQVGDAVTLTKDNTEHTFTLDAATTGSVEIVVTQTSSKAVYIKNLTVVYAE